MTAPKFRAPNQIVEVTRRTSHRQMLLRPGEDTRELIGYMFGKALLDTGQEPIVFCAMSNHHHSIQLDPAGRRSAFMQLFNSNLARKRNLQLGRRENLWSSSQPGDMVLLDVESVVRKIVYVAVQAVKANCVEHAGEWTGFQILPRDWGKPMRFKRPEFCGPEMPEFVEFTPMPPPSFRHLPLPDVIAFFEDLIAKEEKRIASKRTSPVLGIEYCEAISPFSFPATDSEMRVLNPKFSCSDKVRLFRALNRQRRFTQRHRFARTRFRDGEKDVVFPAGTLQMRCQSGARCAPYCEDDPRHSSNEWSPNLHELWDAWQQNQRSVA